MILTHSTRPLPSNPTGFETSERPRKLCEFADRDMVRQYCRSNRRFVPLDSPADKR